MKKYKHHYTTEKRKINLKYIIILILILIVIIVAGIKIFTKNLVKTNKIGNNSSSQEIVDYILNISSYEVTFDMTVYSNKNENKYTIKQQYQDENCSVQEIIEPNNITGLKIIQEPNKLTLENSKLNLSNVLENYKYIADSCIDLSTFIKEYKNDTNAIVKEENDTIIMQVASQSNNKYIKNKVLKIDRNTGNPISMEVKSDNNKTTIYILYNEVKINNN